MSRTELSDLGEFGLIERLSKPFENKNTSTVFGIGDDAAGIKYEEGRTTLVSTDLLVEGVHFDLMYMPLKHLGYKAVTVNVSDMYAMNAKPEQITVSLAISNRFSVEALEEIYQGIKIACDHYGVDLVGGDTTTSVKGLIISVTVMGSAKPEKIVRRNGAKVGDLICVTGDLGGAYCGLQILEREKKIYLENPKIQPELEQHAYCVGRQLKPEARKDLFEEFEKIDFVPHSMIDVSDGLTSDLTHICKQSGVGAIIEEENVPVHPETYDQALQFQVDPTTVSMHGGEDYELLFTIDPKDVDKIRFMLDVRIIGEIVPAEHGIRLQSKAGKFHDLHAQGWKHF